MLGCELEADPSGAFRIARIFPGESWHPDYRSPLTEPGVEVREGEYLLAIDGVERAALLSSAPSGSLRTEFRPSRG